MTRNWHDDNWTCDACGATEWVDGDGREPWLPVELGWGKGPQGGDLCPACVPETSKGAGHGSWWHEAGKKGQEG